MRCGSVGRLQKLTCGAACLSCPLSRCKIVELQKVAKACGHTKTGLRNLVQAVLEPTAGMPKSKKLANFDWTQPLPPAQLRYAILDAACTEHVFRCLECRF